MLCSPMNLVYEDTIVYLLIGLELISETNHVLKALREIHLC